MWQGHAFGFHVRGHPNRVERNKIKEVEVIKKNLEYLEKIFYWSAETQMVFGPAYGLFQLWRLMKR